jgi:hypothetical protein
MGQQPKERLIRDWDLEAAENVRQPHAAILAA